MMMEKLYDERFVYYIDRMEGTELERIRQDGLENHLLSTNQGSFNGQGIFVINKHLRLLTDKINIADLTISNIFSV